MPISFCYLIRYYCSLSVGHTIPSPDVICFSNHQDRSPEEEAGIWVESSEIVRPTRFLRCGSHEDHWSTDIVLFLDLHSPTMKWHQHYKLWRATEHIRERVGLLQDTFYPGSSTAGCLGEDSLRRELTTVVVPLTATNLRYQHFTSMLVCFSLW